MEFYEDSVYIYIWKKKPVVQTRDLLSLEFSHIINKASSIKLTVFAAVWVRYKYYIFLKRRTITYIILTAQIFPFLYLLKKKFSEYSQNFLIFIYFFFIKSDNILTQFR